MTSEEHPSLKALQRQVQYLQEQLRVHAQAIPAQWRALAVAVAENANVEEPVMASSSPVPPIANEPAKGEHTRAQPSTAPANLKSNSATYAEAVMSSVPDVKQRTRTNDNDRVHPANAASSLATAGTEPPMSPGTVLRHNASDFADSDNAEAAALLVSRRRRRRPGRRRRQRPEDPSYCAAGRRCHRQRTSTDNSTGPTARPSA
jgi:hypothetical protein